jgi:hypothetical protein
MNYRFHHPTTHRTLRVIRRALTIPEADELRDLICL